MVDRRGFLTGAVGAGLVLGAPALVRAAAERPQLKYGTASGSISHNGAAIWTRADRPVQMHLGVPKIRLGDSLLT